MANKLFLHNSLTGSKEEFTPIDASHVRVYVCGPTVYASPHLGNARSTVVYDLLYRVLKQLYNKVTYARNITDIDDKINQAAIEQNLSIFDLTKEVTEEFQHDMREIGNLNPDLEPKATDNLEAIIALIEKLIENGNAYVSQGHVLFSVKSFDDYGKLSGRDSEEQIAGARIAVESYKKDPGDFVLWKPAKESDDESAKFDSPWGVGRPGWHIECSAMSSKYLGEDFDIHGGGADLKFPHHENEIAQSRCANPSSHYAKYWVHNGFLTVNGEKMSKSLGNFITVRELLGNGVQGRVLRLILLNTHYRKPLDYNMKTLTDARKSLERFDEFYNSGTETSENLPDKFFTPLLDDLNISEAIAYLHKMAKEGKNVADFRAAIDFIGLTPKDEKQDIPKEDRDLVNELKIARQEKNYQEADRIRDLLVAKGYNLQYTRDGDVIIK